MPDARSPVRVLVGDDEAEIRRLVQEVLRSGEYDIDLSQDGRDLFERYHPGGHGLLILDTVLRHMSGLEVVMKLRDRGDGVPIILMSGPRTENDRVEPFAFTYRVDVLRKPFGVGDLRSAVVRALRSKPGD